MGAEDLDQRFARVWPVMPALGHGGNGRIGLIRTMIWPKFWPRIWPRIWLRVQPSRPGVGCLFPFGGGVRLCCGIAAAIF